MSYSTTCITLTQEDKDVIVNTAIDEFSCFARRDGKLHIFNFDQCFTEEGLFTCVPTFSNIEYVIRKSFKGSRTELACKKVARDYVHNNMTHRQKKVLKYAFRLPVDVDVQWYIHHMLYDLYIDAVIDSLFDPTLYPKV